MKIIRVEIILGAIFILIAYACDLPALYFISGIPLGHAAYLYWLRSFIKGKRTPFIFIALYVLAFAILFELRWYWVIPIVILFAIVYFVLDLADYLSSSSNEIFVDE